MEKLVETLKKKHLTIASCESLTGGLFAARMTEIPGVSAVMKGGIVSYWTEIKESVVGVSHKTVKEYGVVSEQTAFEMADNVKREFETDIAVSFTGNAGPDTMEGKPAGLVYTCIIVGEKVYPFKDQINMPRNQLREEIVERTAKRIKECIDTDTK